MSDLWVLWRQLQLKKGLKLFGVDSLPVFKDKSSSTDSLLDFTSLLEISCGEITQTRTLLFYRKHLPEWLQARLESLLPTPLMLLRFACKLKASCLLQTVLTLDPSIATHKPSLKMELADFGLDGVPTLCATQSLSLQRWLLTINSNRSASKTGDGQTVFLLPSSAPSLLDMSAQLLDPLSMSSRLASWIFLLEKVYLEWSKEWLLRKELEDSTEGSLLTSWDWEAGTSLCSWPLNKLRKCSLDLTFA